MAAVDHFLKVQDFHKEGICMHHKAFQSVQMQEGDYTVKLDTKNPLKLTPSTLGYELINHHLS